MDKIKESKLSSFLFLLFFVGIIVSTYFSFFYQYVFISTFIIIVYLILKKNNNTKLKINDFSFFLLYYLIISIISLIIGYTDIINFIKFLITYFVLPFDIYYLIPNDKKTKDKLIHYIKIFFLIVCIYGVIEGLLQHNYMPDFIKISQKSWQVSMNKSSLYQCSSIFLHYNYYGMVLIIAYLFNNIYKFKNKLLNVFYTIIVLEQIVFCQSRTAWLLMIIILFFQFINYFFIAKKSNLKNALLIISIFILTSIIIMFIFPEFYLNIYNFVYRRLFRIFKYGFQDGSVGQRIGTLMNWRYFIDDNFIHGLFGTGFNSVNTLYLPNYSYFKGFATTDNEITVFLVETGIIGCTLIVSAIIKLYKKIKAYNMIISKIGLVVFSFYCLTLDFINNNIVYSLVLFLIIFDYKNYLKKEAKDDISNNTSL